MSKCKISTKYIIGKFENIYVYFSLFLFLSFAFDLAENLICTPKKKKNSFHRPFLRAKYLNWIYNFYTRKYLSDN